MRLTIIVALTTLLPLSQAFAHSRKDAELLDDSSAALATSHPDLSQRLKRFAVREIGEKESAGRIEMEPQSEDVQLLKNCAAALRPSRPELSKGLEGLAAREEHERRQERSSSRERSRRLREPIPSQTQPIPGMGY